MIQQEKEISEILRTQYFAVLSSVDINKPYSNLISYAVTDNLKNLIFLTDRRTQKYRNIQLNNAISVLIDNRSNSTLDIESATAVTITGTARESGEKNSLRRVFLLKHPELESFFNLPDTAMIVVDIQEYIIAGFHSSRRITMT